MILLIVLAVAFVTLCALGGNPRALARARWREGWLILAAVGIQLATIFLPDLQDDRLTQWRGLTFIITYLVALLFLWLNRALPGLKLVLLGTALNFSVMLVHGGFMPVSPEALQLAGHDGLVEEWRAGAPVAESKDILLPTELTRLWFLSDIFTIPAGLPIPGSFSLGDVLIAAGAIRFLQRSMRSPSSSEEENSNSNEEGGDSLG